MTKKDSTVKTTNAEIFVRQISKQNELKIETKNDQYKQSVLLNIFKNRLISVNRDFLIEVSKSNSKTTNKTSKNCKILQFSSDLSFDELLETLSSLDKVKYPNLFIFVINQQSCDIQETKYEIFFKILLKFGENRSMIVRLWSENENKTDFFYKEETSLEFLSEQNENSLSFSTFLFSFLNDEFKGFEDEAIQRILNFQSLSLVLRFLRIINLNDEFYERILKQVSRNATKVEFLAALDAPFNCNGRFLNDKSQEYLMREFTIEENKNSDDLQVNNSVATMISTSILFIALTHKNNEIINYLTAYWSGLIQQLSFNHRIQISTTAFETNQFDVLCDLLELSDFPFPHNFDPDNDSITNERLRQITSERVSFTNAIKRKNFKMIDKFINSNLSLRFVYDPCQINF